MPASADIVEIRKTSLKLHRHAAVVHGQVSNALRHINTCLPEGHADDMIVVPYQVATVLQLARSALSKSLKTLVLIGTTNTELRTQSKTALQISLRNLKRATTTKKKSTARSAANTARLQSRCTEPWRQMFAEWKQINQWSSPLYPKRDTPECPCSICKSDC